LSELLRSYLGHAAHGLHLAIYGGIVIVVMLYFPSGIAGILERLASVQHKKPP
jgi:ABC-type branched-subunit amino acid transport system permease subunit